MSGFYCFLGADTLGGGLVSSRRGPPMTSEWHGRFYAHVALLIS